MNTLTVRDADRSRPNNEVYCTLAPNVSALFALERFGMGTPSSPLQFHVVSLLEFDRENLTHVFALTSHPQSPQSAHILGSPSIYPNPYTNFVAPGGPVELTVVVVCEDQGSPARRATARAVVEIADVNDNEPQFTQREYRSSVREGSAPGTELPDFGLRATDPDVGENAKVSYSLDPTGRHYFSIDEKTARIRTLVNFDRETRCDKNRCTRTYSYIEPFS